MPENISETKTRGSLTIEAADVIRLLRELKNLPESCFLCELRSPAEECLLEGRRQERLTVTNFQWSGEYSGTGLRRVLPMIAQKLRGEAEVLLVWESGDLSVLRIKDGQVREHEAQWAAAEKFARKISSED